MDKTETVTTCKQCGKPFSVLKGESRKGRQYCNKTCSGLARRQYIVLVCKFCKQSFKVRPCESDRQYCSRNCKDQAQGIAYAIPPIAVSCTQCGKPFLASPYDVEKGRQFCSRQCHYAAETQLATVTLICTECGKPFPVLRGDVHKGRKCCSRACGGLARRKRIVLICAFCKQSFEVESNERNRQYCSQKCKGKAQSAVHIATAIMGNCAQCGKPFLMRKSDVRNGKKYCSGVCQRLAKRVMLTCQFCQQPFTVRACESTRRFCCRECQAISIKVKTTKHCTECGKAFYAPASSNRKYCSRECFRKSTIDFRKTEHYALGQIDKALYHKHECLREHTFDWLVNPTTGYHLHLDAFYPALNLAIEYNGAYHYVNRSHFDPRYPLEYRQRLDALKAQLVTDHGITLFVLKYDAPRDLRSLRKRLRAVGIRP